MLKNAPAMWSKNQNLLQGLVLKNGVRVNSLDRFKAYLAELEALGDFSGALFSFIKIR